MSAIDNARATLVERIASTLASMPMKTAQRRARDLDIIVPLWALDEMLAEHERLTAQASITPALREELDGWGFRGVRGGAPGFRLSASGHALFYSDDASEENDYRLAESSYYGGDTDPHRPFLAVVLDVLRIADGLPTGTNEGSA